MRKQERFDLINSLQENFIEDFHLEDLKDAEKEFFLSFALNARMNYDQFKSGGIEGRIISNTSAANIQNFHILKALKENNEKLDLLNNKFDTLIELLSKDK